MQFWRERVGGPVNRDGAERSDWVGGRLGRKHVEGGIPTAVNLGRAPSFAVLGSTKGGAGGLQGLGR